jgi:murein DD-endopeptidase MepM/ murein hydrolase activator NlpD
MAPGKGLTLLLLTEDGREVRKLHLSRSRIRAGAATAAFLLVALGAMVGTWWFFALRSLQVTDLRARVATLEAERAELVELAATLEDVENEYERIRDIFGAATPGLTSELWLPPPAAGRRGGADEAALRDPIPDSWPLTEPGYITQNLLRGAGGAHPGIDIAVPMDSYIRASGAGRVVEASSDSVYGNYVVLDHGNGYRSRYAHASLLLVETGREVRKNEVIALSGSSGRSTAPHLHFEILLDGDAVDPLELVAPPGA